MTGYDPQKRPPKISMSVVQSPQNATDTIAVPSINEGRGWLVDEFDGAILMTKQRVHSGYQYLGPAADSQMSSTSWRKHGEGASALSVEPEGIDELF